MSYRGVRGRPGRQARADRRRASTSTSTSTTATTRSRPTPWPWSATARPSASSTSSCSRRWTASRTCTTAREIAAGRHPHPDRDPDTLLTDLSDTVESVDKQALQTTVDRARARRSAAPARTSSGSSTPATRSSSRPTQNFDITTALIRDSNTVLHGPDRLGRRDPDLRPRPVAVQRHPGRLRPGPAQGHRQRLGHRQPAAHASSRTTGSTSAELINNLVTTGDVVVKHLDGRRADPGDLPLRRRGRLHRRLEVAGHRAVRRPLRHDPHPGPRRSATPATRAPTRRPAAGRQQPADEHRARTAPSRRTQSNARGAQNAPRAPGRLPRAVVASYDRHRSCTGAARCRVTLARLAGPATLGEESWKWLFLQPLMTSRE